MRAEKIIKAVILLLIVFTLMQSGIAGSVQVTSMSPVSVDLCGGYPQYTTFSLTGIRNLESVPLTSVAATLYVTGNSGLSFITPQSINIGDIAVNSVSGTVPTWILQCNNPHDGVYYAYVNFTSANGYKATTLDNNAYSTVIVHGQALLLVNATLIEGARINSSGSESVPVLLDSTPTIKVTTNKDSVCKGSLDANEAYDAMDFIFYGAATTHEYTFLTPISQGAHTVFVQCKDSQENLLPNAIELKFIIDTTIPEIQVTSSLTTTTDYTLLSITTAKKAECRYGTDNDKFSDLDEFENSEETSFSTVVEGLDLGENEYYILCKDSNGNFAEREIIIKYEKAPAAKITLSDISPVKAGIIEIRLDTSKTLRSIPKLSYSFTDSNTFTREISLIKASGYYSGYMVIEKSDLPRVGVFSFSGTDLTGIVGTEITEGKNFLVDTIPPTDVRSIDAQADSDGNIQIKWYYDGEEEENFNVYRSASSGVDYIHYFKKTADDEFTDEEVIAGTTYYYKVAAVDKAGNIGPLSREVSKLAAKSGAATAALANVDVPKYDTLIDFNKTLKSIEKLEIDINWAENALNEQKGKESAIDELALVKKVLDAKGELSKLKAQFKDINPLTYTNADLLQHISRAKSIVNNLQKTTPQKLDVVKKTELVQPISNADVDEAVAEVTRDTNYTNSQLKYYKEKIYAFSGNIKITSEIKTLSIVYLFGNTEGRVLVTKKVTYESPEELTNVKLLEIIPKTVASDLGTVDIKTPDYVIIKQDPIVGWNLVKLSYDQFEIKYFILTEDTSESAKNTKTVVLLRPESVIKPSSNLVTGFVSQISRISPYGLMQTLFMLAGVGLLVSLLLYYLVAIQEVKFGKVGEIMARFIPNKKGEQEAVPVGQALSNEQKTFVQEKLVPIQPPEIKIEVHENKQTPSVAGNIAAAQSLNHIVLDYNLITSPSQYFFLSNGDVIRSIEEFFSIVPELDEATFYNHVNNQKNDFANWIASVFHMPGLGEAIQMAKTKEELVTIISSIKK
ncbi:MAG: hypothetical protein V1859_10620 [archaeon]